MREPTKTEVDCALRRLAQPFITDAERGNERGPLPLVNVHDSGRPTLDTDAVLRRSEPQHALVVGGRKWLWWLG